MKIGIIGGGAIGLLCAHFLKKNHDLTVYVSSIEQKDSLNNFGLTYIHKNNTETEDIQACIFQDWKGEEELTILAVKQYHLEEVYNKMILHPHMENGLLFLQNGMSHLKVIEKLPNKNILLGIVDHGAVRLNSHSVQHTGIGTIKLGALFHNMDKWIDQLQNDNPVAFNVKKEQNIFSAMNKKLVVNSIVNPLTSILQIQNGKLIDNNYYYRFTSLYMKEITDILQLSQEEHDSYLSYLLEVIEKTAENKSSMRKDIEENKQTEIDSILGYLLEEANNKNISAPITLSIYLMIKGMEREGRVKNR